VAGESSYGSNIRWLFSIGEDSKVLWYFPNEDLFLMSMCVYLMYPSVLALPSSEAEEINESLNGLLYGNQCRALYYPTVWISIASIVPVGVEDSCGVSTEKRKLLWHATPLVDGNDSECASTAGLPIDGDVFGIGLFTIQHFFLYMVRRWALADLDQICIPCVGRNAKVIVTLFLLRKLVRATRKDVMEAKRVYLLCPSPEDVT